MSRIVIDAETGAVSRDDSYVADDLTEDRVPDSVSARQFRLQLRAAGIRDQVLAFIAQQSGEVQDAFEYSGSFVRGDPMMQAGFTALGFSQEQQNQFWVEAGKL